MIIKIIKENSYDQHAWYNNIQSYKYPDGSIRAGSQSKIGEEYNVEEYKFNDEYYITVDPIYGKTLKGLIRKEDCKIIK